MLQPFVKDNCIKLSINRGTFKVEMTLHFLLAAKLIQEYEIKSPAKPKLVAMEVQNK